GAGRRRGGSPPLEQQRPEIVVRAPSRRVLARRVAPERLEIREEVRPAPGGGAEGEEEPAARKAGRRSEGGGVPRPGGPERDEQRDRAEARQILEVIGDEGVAERVGVDEAERRQKGERNAEQRRQQ